MTTQLEQIRAACIRANPTIRENFNRCMNCGYGFAYCKKQRMCPKKFRDRPIHLADVLLAIGEALEGQTIEGGGNASLDVHTSGLFTGNFFDWESDQVYFWNLRNDNLENQLPQTIEFISSLLRI